MSEKISFDVDWEALFPGKKFTVGSKTINITPLNIENIAKVTRKIKTIMPMLKAEGIDWDGLNNPEMIVKLIPILMDNAPEMISEATGIDIESLVKFPPEYMLQLVTIVIEVNLESKDALEKNFESLVKTFQDLPEMKEQEMAS